MAPEERHDAVWKRFLKDKNAADRDFLARSYFFLVEAENRRLLARLPVKAYWEKKDDLASAGSIGLLQALDHFAPPKGKAGSPGRAFEAYARYRIRGQMVDELRHMDFARRNLRKQEKSIQEARYRLQQKNGREPTDEEAAKSLGMPLDEFYGVVAEINMLNLLSLDAELAGSRGEKGVWSDILPDPRAENALDKVEKQEKIEIVSAALKKLGDSEQKVLQFYYVENLTFKEVGRVLGVSESRICQIHHMAVFKLQKMVDERREHDGAQHGRLYHHHP
ncbi:MAG TPA: FliA/WhiG family RNA polymerase sigma factor [bacterium]|nr:FliA/WhiG family RNA polymerase sigma factor [bacterium]